MVEHPRRDDRVELRNAERNLPNGRDQSVHAARTCQLDHARGLVQCDDRVAELVANPLRELHPTRTPASSTRRGASARSSSGTPSRASLPEFP